MPRFVVLFHELPPESNRPSHWDFMLEYGSVLRTWAFESPWDSSTGGMAEALPDHRLAYLDYEGPVAGNRGQVSRIEQGFFQIVHENDVEIRVELIGQHRSGILVLTKENELKNQWRFQFLD